LSKRHAGAIGWQGSSSRQTNCQAPGAGKGFAVDQKHTTPTLLGPGRLNADGSASLLTSTVEMGQGALISWRTVGDELGLPLT
jgi:hypothetical protein